MKTNGYLEHLDLGTDEESGKPNILVNSAQEYQALSEEEKGRAWATIKVTSDISERDTSAFYAKVYSGRIPSKTIKKNPWDRRGLTLIKVPSARSKGDKRNDDITRVVRVVRRTLKATSWLPGGQDLLLSAIVEMRLRNIERELFNGNNSQLTTTEGNHGNQES
jgi:hypothetical protein